MADAGPRQLIALSAHIEGLEAAVQGLEAEPSIGDSLRRIARSLQSAAQGVGATEIAAGAQAIQRATDAQLLRSVRIFLERIDELRNAAPLQDVDILIVEDDRTTATTVAAYLAGPGRTIHHAFTAAEAVEALRDRPIDVVVLDLLLPDRDGRDLLVEMRETARTTTIPVVVLTASSGPVTRAECLAVGADDFIEKSADPRVLRSSVSRLLQHARARTDAVRDGLTGLPNRVGMVEHLERLRAATSAAGAPLTVGVLRLGGMEDVVEVLGQDAADRFLLEVAFTVFARLPDGAVLGRWETGELVALLPGLAAPDGHAFLTDALGALIDVHGLGRLKRAGVGIEFGGGALEMPEGQSLREALSRAERAIYETKPRFVAAGRQGQPIRKVPRILLVEDDRLTSTLIRHRLERDGFTVSEVASGEDALAWAAEDDCDLAVLDVNLQGTGGFGLLERLRAIDRYADVPILMMTGLGSEADVVRGLELGADDYILKPFSPTELLARVRRLLHAHSTAGGASGQRVRRVSAS